MAQLKDLIVNGPSRFIGDVYATTFTGNLAGNANTATSATTAAALTGKTLVTASAVTTSNYPTYVSNHIPTMSFIAYWNGAYSGTSSNLTYCKQGTIIGSSNIGSQSVNYATSSGSCSGNAATATKAGCLDTGTMTLYANGGNEINFGGTNTSSNIYFGYRAIGSKPIPTSFIFGGSGTATLTAGGFKKNGSSASYVLTGDGGHAAISGLSVNYANSSGSCSGNAATATNASSAGNADKLDGVHYQNILERFYSGYSSSGTATGWFRIAETLIDDGMGPTFLLAIQRGYSYTNNESYLFSISVSFGGGISITQLSGYANTRLITKIRVDWSHSQIAYVDLYIGSSSKTNDYFWYTVGCAKSYTSWTANPTLVGDAHEFTTVNGCKSDLGFNGYLRGTADSASKWVYARTITLTGSVTGSVSIDGSANVSLATTTNHTHNYLPLSGGTMSNTNKVTNLNADLLDGYHASSFSLTSHTHSYIVTQGDNRSIATKPSDYINRITFAGLKTNTTIGKPSTSTYSYVVGLRGWSDTSGGKAHELAFNDNGIFHRIGATDTWETWKQIAFLDSNVASATKLANSRTLWGHNFDGTGNVSGALSGVTTINSTLYIDLSGNIGIGTASPSYKLYVDGDGYFVDNVTTESDFLSLGNAIIDGYVGIGTKNPAYKLDVNGTIQCTKLLQTSDIKYKTNIKQIEYEEALKIIENLNPVTWDWNENTVEIGSSSGFVAQEAEEFIPNAISRDNKNNLSLDYTQLHSYEIKVIQEQQKEIIKLKEKLKILEKLIS